MMRKIACSICICILMVGLSLPVTPVRAESPEDWIVYPLERAVDGFTPPEGETIQHLFGTAMTKEEGLHRSFMRECITVRALRGKRRVCIANPVKRIPCGQSHRLTLAVFGEKTQEAAWYSSHPDIVAVDRITGELSALQTGMARVWVTDAAGRLQDAFTLEVVEALSEEVKKEMLIDGRSNVVGKNWGDVLWEDPETGEWGLVPDMWFEDVEELLLPDDAPALAECFGSQRLGQVRIPASVKAMARDEIFQYTRALVRGSKVSFSVDGNNTNYYSVGDVLFCYPFYVADDPESPIIKVTWRHYGECGSRMLLCYPGERKGEVYYVPYGVERIADGAFSDVKYLRRVVLPDTVTSIGQEAINGFHGGIEEIVIPASVTEFGGDSGRALAIQYATIITPAGSAAEAYAIENGLPYRNE